MAVDDNTPDVTTDDQQLINRFSCLNMKNAELKASIQLKNDYIKTLADAEEEVMICVDNEGLMLSIGESYFVSGEEDVTEFLEQEKAEQQKTLSQLEAKLVGVQTEMATLKARLKATFGNSINLDA